jgi:hypothetical protein
MMISTCGLCSCLCASTSSLRTRIWSFLAGKHHLNTLRKWWQHQRAQTYFSGRAICAAWCSFPKSSNDPTFGGHLRDKKRTCAHLPCCYLKLVPAEAEAPGSGQPPLYFLFPWVSACSWYVGHVARKIETK